MNTQAIANLIPLVGSTVVELIKIVESFKTIQVTNLASVADVTALWDMVASNDDAAIAKWHKAFAQAKLDAVSNVVVSEAESPLENAQEPKAEENTALDHAAQGA